MRKLVASLVSAAALLAGAALAADPGQFAYPIQGAPIASVSTSAVSASAALNGGTCYRVACNTTVFWRVGVLPLTALTTDNPFYGPAVELICLRNGYNGIAFVMTAGTGSCVINSYAPSP